MTTVVSKIFFCFLCLYLQLQILKTVIFFADKQVIFLEKSFDQISVFQYLKLPKSSFQQQKCLHFYASLLL